MAEFDDPHGRPLIAATLLNKIVFSLAIPALIAFLSWAGVTLREVHEESKVIEAQHLSSRQLIGELRTEIEERSSVLHGRINDAASTLDLKLKQQDRRIDDLYHLFLANPEGSPKDIAKRLNGQTDE